MNRKTSGFWIGTSLALAAGLLLRLWFVRHMAVIGDDSFLYGDIAKTWLLHGTYGFTETGGPAGTVTVHPTLIRLPGYPMFLAVCFRLFGMEHYRAVMYVQVLADLATCWLASATAGRLFGTRAALVVLWLAVLCPFTANYTATPMTETLVLTTIALAFYGFVRWQDAGCGYNRWLWGVALPLAGSLLLRPEQCLLAAAVLPAMYLRSRRIAPRESCLRALTPVLVAGLCVLLPLLPWTLRNWETFHVFEPLVPHYANDPGELPPTGFGRWYRTWGVEFSSTEEVYWNYPDTRIAARDLPPRVYVGSSPADSEHLREETASLLHDYDATPTLDAVTDARFGELGVERIHAHPVRYYIALPLARLLDMTLRPRTEMIDVPLEWWRFADNLPRCRFAAAYATLNFGYLAVGFAGFSMWRRRMRSSLDTSGLSLFAYRELAWAMVATLALRALLLLTIDNSEPRYTLEFFPVLFVWAGAIFAAQQQGPSAK